MIVEACILGICLIVGCGMIAAKIELHAFTLSHIWDEHVMDAIEANGKDDRPNQGA